jgi:hypothetical protein
MVVAQHLNGQMCGAREIADGERGRHIAKFALSPQGRVNRP